MPTLSIHEVDGITGNDSEITSSSNTVFIVQGKIALEAIEDKIIVQLDKFKSGYECKACNETGKLQLAKCYCTSEGHPGTRFADSPLPCTICKGKPEEVEGKDIECPFCNGKGVTVVIPETSKGIPTSGIIVSVGPECKKRHVAERVIFGPHVGYYLPFKGNVRLRVMREFEPMCVIYALDNNIHLADFVEFEEPINNRD